MRSILLFSDILSSLLLLRSCSSHDEQVDNVTLIVIREIQLAETDENFVCATLDLWPHSKCDFGDCPWGEAGVLNLDLENKILANAIQAFRSLRIRIGGSLQNQVIYQVENYSKNCTPFERNDSGLFGFSEGCLPMDRWDQLNKFFYRTGVITTFGLNALMGRTKSIHDNTLFEGAWNSTNAREFMRYTATNGHKIDSYELGNELSGSGIGARVDAEQYGRDMIVLKNIIKELYSNLSIPAPKLLGPAGFYDHWEWFDKFLNTIEKEEKYLLVVDAITYHFYNLGSGDDTSVIDKVLDPASLDDIAVQMYLNISINMETLHPSSTNIWVSESGGAYTSGSKNVSRAFADGFWYSNQLGMASKYNHKVFCRQTLVGGNYGLLDVKTFQPKPDYYSALLFHRLMGTKVLIAYHVGSVNYRYLRVYAHCSRNRSGISVLVINMSKSTTYQVHVQNYTNTNFSREEYHLTPKDDDILSQEVLLNGELLNLTESSRIPEMKPLLVNATSPMKVGPYSIVFATLKSFNATICG